MPLVVDIGAVAGGIVLGAGVGYAVGRRVMGNGRAFWRAIAVAMAVCVASDLAGLAVGQRWIVLGSLGMMAGVLTGLKYGGIADVRFWELPAARGVDASQHTDAPGAEDADAHQQRADRSES